MRSLTAAWALAALVWGCDVKAAQVSTVQPKPQSDGPTWTARVKIDDV